ncbi:hypothetical protein QFC19_003543 [Naganishia cerealis]|uniref:Uncharacterized protein n=1 Tax=Naganishia cerealis TaxID=610337 RepID=A0ACC2W2F9_9TREE|nr:hypothetical protein QFC19_003543 [Naganishia cerealis]
MADCSFGITGKDFVLLASDQSAGRSIIKMKSDENKIRTLSPGLALAFGGEPGEFTSLGKRRLMGGTSNELAKRGGESDMIKRDTNNFVDYVERNLRLYQIRNNTELLPAPASAFIRKELANSIRSRSPYAVNLLLGGYDKVHSEAHLYSIDLYGTKAILPYAAQGLGIYVALSTMDKYWYPDITRDEAVELLKKCVAEVKLRLAYQFTFNAIVIDKEGVKNLPL